MAQPLLHVDEFLGGEQSLLFLWPEAEERQRAVRARARSREHLVIEASLPQIGFRGRSASLQLDQTPLRTARRAENGVGHAGQNDSVRPALLAQLPAQRLFGDEQRAVQRSPTLVRLP